MAGFSIWWKCFGAVLLPKLFCVSVQINPGLWISLGPWGTLLLVHWAQCKQPTRLFQNLKAEQTFYSVSLPLLFFTHRSQAILSGDISASRALPGWTFHPHEGLWKRSGLRGSFLVFFLKKLASVPERKGVTCGTIVFLLPGWIRYLHGSVIHRASCIDQ